VGGVVEVWPEGFHKQYLIVGDEFPLFWEEVRSLEAPSRGHQHSLLSTDQSSFIHHHLYSAAFIHHSIQCSIHSSYFTTEQHSFITVYRAAFIHHSLQSSIHSSQFRAEQHSLHHNSEQHLFISSSQFTEQHSFITVYRAAFIHHSIQSSIHSSQFTEQHSFITVYREAFIHHNLQAAFIHHSSEQHLLITIQSNMHS
jgi:hypothetical protein